MQFTLYAAPSTMREDGSLLAHFKNQTRFKMSNIFLYLILHVSPPFLWVSFTKRYYFDGLVQRINNGYTSVLH